MMISGCMRLLLVQLSCYGVQVISQSTWLLTTSALQRQIEADIPLNKAVIVGTHNSYNMGETTSSLFETVPNQMYSITTQLDCFGVRALEIDPHYIAPLNSTLVCHAGAEAAPEVVKLCQSLGWSFCEGCGVYDYGANSTGCRKDAPTLQDMFTEIAQWTTKVENKKEVVVVKLDSFMGEGHEVLVSQAIESVFHLGTIYTPDEWQAGGRIWPSIGELSDTGKQLVFFSNEPWRYIFSRTDTSEGVEEEIISLDKLTGPPVCNKKPQPNPPSVKAQGSSSVIEVNVANFTIFQGGSVNQTQWAPSYVDKAQSCGFSPTFDMAQEALTVATIWSWDTNYPTGPSQGTQSCATIARPSGRWRDEQCQDSSSSSYYHACVSIADRTQWTLSTVPSTFTTTPACPNGYSFGAPQTKFENDALLEVLRTQAVSVAWLYLIGSSAICWTREGSVTERCLQQRYTEQTCSNISGGAWTQKPPTTCLDSLAPDWFDSVGYQAPVYAPSKIVDRAHKINRIKGTNEWSSEMSYAEATIDNGIPVVVVGVLLCFFALPVFTCWAYRRGRNEDKDDDHEAVGRFAALRRSKRKCQCAVASAFIAVAGGVLSIWACSQLNDATSALSYNMRGVANVIVGVQDAAENAQVYYDQALSVIAPLLTCEDFTTVFDGVDQAITRGSDAVNTFVEEDIGSIGEQVNDKLDTVDESESMRKAILLSFSVLGLLLGFLYVVMTCNAGRVLYSRRLEHFVMQRGEAASTSASDDIELSEASSSLRNGGSIGGAGDDDKTAAVAGRGSGRRCKQCTGCGLTGLTCVTAVMLLTVWMLLAIGLVLILYSSDFCVAPTDNIVSIPDNQVYIDTVRYYSDCKDNPQWQGDLLQGYIYTYTSSVALDAIDEGEFGASCPTLTDDLTALQVLLRKILKEFNMAGKESACSTINPYYNDGVNVALCTDTTSALAWLTLGSLIAGVFLLFAGLLLPCVLKDTQSFRRKRRRSLWREQQVEESQLPRMFQSGGRRASGSNEIGDNVVNPIYGPRESEAVI